MERSRGKGVRVRRELGPRAMGPRWQARREPDYDCQSTKLLPIAIATGADVVAVRNSFHSSSHAAGEGLPPFIELREKIYDDAGGLQKGGSGSVGTMTGAGGGIRQGDVDKVVENIVASYKKQRDSQNLGEASVGGNNGEHLGGGKVGLERDVEKMVAEIMDKYNRQRALQRAHDSAALGGNNGKCVPSRSNTEAVEACESHPTSGEKGGEEVGAAENTTESSRGQLGGKASVQSFSASPARLTIEPEHEDKPEHSTPTRLPIENADKRLENSSIEEESTRLGDHIVSAPLVCNQTQPRPSSSVADVNSQDSRCPGARGNTGVSLAFVKAPIQGEDPKNGQKGGEEEKGREEKPVDSVISSWASLTTIEPKDDHLESDMQMLFGNPDEPLRNMVSNSPVCDLPQSVLSPSPISSTGEESPGDGTASALGKEIVSSSTEEASPGDAALEDIKALFERAGKSTSAKVPSHLLPPYPLSRMARLNYQKTVSASNTSSIKDSEPPSPTPLPCLPSVIDDKPPTRAPPPVPTFDNVKETMVSKRRRERDQRKRERAMRAASEAGAPSVPRTSSTSSTHTKPMAALTLDSDQEARLHSALRSRQRVGGKKKTNKLKELYNGVRNAVRIPFLKRGEELSAKSDKEKTQNQDDHDGHHSKSPGEEVWGTLVTEFEKSLEFSPKRELWAKIADKIGNKPKGHLPKHSTPNFLIEQMMDLRGYLESYPLSKKPKSTNPSAETILKITDTGLTEEQMDLDDNSKAEPESEHLLRAVKELVESFNLFRIPYGDSRSKCISVMAYLLAIWNLDAALRRSGLPPNSDERKYLELTFLKYSYQYRLLSTPGNNDLVDLCLPLQALQNLATAIMARLGITSTLR